MPARNSPFLRTFPVPRALQFAAGLLALLVGAGVYAIRDTAAQPAVGWIAPSFIHVFAMVLLVAALAPPTRRGAFGLCAAWVSISGLFEIAQRPEFARPIYHWLLAQCGGLSPCRHSALFFRQGTFDPLDLVAAGAGGACAWLLLRQTSKLAWSGA